MEVNYKIKTKPYAHQQTALTNSISSRLYAFFMEMGTGKSKVLIDTIATLAHHQEIDFALVIAPKGVYRNWVNKEIPDHFSEDVPHQVCYWQAKDTKAYRDELKQFFFNTEPGVKIFVMNVEAFSSGKGKKMGDWLATKFSHNGLIAIDESTTIKNPKANRTKSLTKMASHFKYRRLLTGSPVTKSPMDLYTQCEFLAPRLLGFDSYYSFRGHYAVLQKQKMGIKEFQTIVGYKNLHELSHKLEGFSYRVLKKDCLDLPEKVYTMRNVEMTPQQLRMYKDIQKEAMVLLDNGEIVTAMQMIVQLLRLQQLLSGHLKTDDGEMVEVETNRIAALLECIEEVSGKIIIWSRFRYDIQKIFTTLQRQFGDDSVVCYYGDTSDDDRQKAIQKFQHGDARFFVANPATAGYGLTLTEANTVIYYANDFNLETRIQSEDRCHRIGQRNTVTYIDLITEDSIDMRIVKALRDKIDIGAKVLAEEAREWLQIRK